MGCQPTQRLRKEIDCPDGWREAYVERAAIADPNAFVRGVTILATHVVPDNYVCEVTRVEAGVFGCLNPGAPIPTISQIDQLHWWATRSDAHAQAPLVPPPGPIDWHLAFVQSANVPDDGNAPPPNGTTFPVPINVLPPLPFGDVERLWPDLRTGAISYAAHKIVVGPRLVGIVAYWNQPPGPPNPLALPYQLALSWGILEGRDLRYDSEEARRLLIGGLT